MEYSATRIGGKNIKYCRMLLSYIKWEGLCEMPTERRMIKHLLRSQPWMSQYALLLMILTCFKSNKTEDVNPALPSKNLPSMHFSKIGANFWVERLFFVSFTIFCFEINSPTARKYNPNYVHWFSPRLASIVSLATKRRSLSAPGPGLILFRSPTLEQCGSPEHQAPGVKLPFFRPSNSLSILSKTRAFCLNLRAKAALLEIISLVSLSERMCGCCPGGLSQEM